MLNVNFKGESPLPVAVDDQMVTGLLVEPIMEPSKIPMVSRLLVDSNLKPDRLFLSYIYFQSGV